MRTSSTIPMTPRITHSELVFMVCPFWLKDEDKDDDNNDDSQQAGPENHGCNSHTLILHGSPFWSIPFHTP